MKHLKTAALLIALSSAAQALDLGHDLKLSGFGTLGSISSTTRQADYLSNNYFQDDGVGRSNGTSLLVDTRMGLQLDWQATEDLSFTTQAISKQSYNGDWSPTLEMAFAKYNLIPELAIRAGRIRPAIYMLSEFIDVNYANPWVRSPIEFYSSLSISSMEGLDFLWRPKTGPVSWLVQPFYGNSELGARAETVPVINDDIYGLNLSASINDLTLRAGYTATQFTKYSKSIVNALSLSCNYPNAFVRDPFACSLIGTMNPVDKRISFSSLGATWDNGDYFVSGEIAKRNSEGVILDVTTWYISGGGRLGKFTPYATYSSYTVDSSTRFTAGKALTNSIVTSMYSGQSGDQNSFTLGLRYDVLSNIALKAQWDRIDTATQNGQAGTGRGLFVNPSATSTFPNNNNTVDLFSISMDFVF
jgi:hypothetical protein